MAGKFVATPYDAITYKIIGCAMAVHRELGPGLKEAKGSGELHGRCFSILRASQVSCCL